MDEKGKKVRWPAETKETEGRNTIKPLSESSGAPQAKKAREAATRKPRKASCASRVGGTRSRGLTALRGGLGRASYTQEHEFIGAKRII